jgi:vitamin B12 transporter
MPHREREWRVDADPDEEFRNSSVHRRSGAIDSTRMKIVAVVLVSLLALASAAAAQSRVIITGVVTDSSGGVVPGALVEALSGTQIAAASTTGQDGRYRLEVPEGSYQIRARLAGFADEIGDLGARAPVTRDLILEPAAVGDMLVVTAARTAETRANSTASVAVFTAADLEALGSTSVADVLRIVPGLSVESNGREGALASLFSRGGESDYNLVLIDGVRVNNTGGMFDFSRVSAAEIERVEVVRGGQSALYGSDAMGAVVQIFTKRASPSDAPQFSGSLEGGTFNTWRAHARVAGGAGQRVDYHGGVSYRGTDGAFGDILPENDRFDQAAFDGSIGAVLGDRATVRSGLRYSDANGRGVGAIAFGSRDTGTASDTRDLSWHLGVTHRIAPRVTGSGTVAYSRSDSNVADRIADPSFNLFAILSGTPGAVFPASPRLVRFIDQAAFNAVRAGTQPLAAGQFIASTPFGVGDFPFTSATKFRRPSFKYQADVAWRTGQTLTGGYEYEKESDPLNAGFALDNHAFFVQQQLTLASRWFVTVGARGDNNSHYGSTTSPKVSAGGFLLPFTNGAVSSVKTFVNVGKGIKNPVFGELFGSAFSDGNPNLNAERARTVDVGSELTFASQRVRTTVTYFNNSYEDQVAFRSSGPGRDGQPDFINIAGSEANGWELEAVLQRPVAGLTAAATYALVDTKVTATTSTSQQFQPGQPLLRRPKHSGAIRLGYAAGRATVNVDARFVGERHDAAFLGLSAVPSPGSPILATRSVDITVNPGYTVVGIGGEYRLRDEAALFVRIDNLGDTEYQGALGYPGLPRAAVIGARFTVGGRR